MAKKNNFGLITVIVLVSLAGIFLLSPGREAITSNTLGYWSLDGNALDQSQYRHNGVLTNVNYVAGYKGQAARFTDNSMIAFPVGPEYANLHDAFTIEMIIKPEQIRHSYLAYKRGSFLFQMRPVVNATYGSLEFGMYYLNGAGDYVWPNYPPTQTAYVENDAISVGKTSYLAATWDGSNLRVYINGVLRRTAPSHGKTTRYDATSLVSIGNNVHSVYGSVMNRDYTGTIQNFELTRGAKSATEIAATYTDLQNPQVCVPGVRECVVGSNAYRICNSLGTAWTTTSCLSSQQCSAGACVNVCVPRTCAQLGKNCGTVNECGQPINCGTCAAGSTCINNVCVFEKTCVDTDGGDEPQIKGTLSGMWSTGTTFTRVDKCIEGTNTLQEYVCDEIKNPLIINYTCESGCDDGACNPTTQQDVVTGSYSDPEFVYSGIAYTGASFNCKSYELFEIPTSYAAAVLVDDFVTGDCKFSFEKALTKAGSKEFFADYLLFFVFGIALIVFAVVKRKELVKVFK